MKYSKFSPNRRAESETIQEFVQRSRLTPEQIAWQQAQPVTGCPSLGRLRAALEEAGFKNIDLQLSADRQDLEFNLLVTAKVAAEDNEALLRLLIRTFRAAGFAVGFEEVGIIDVNRRLISGHALTRPVGELAEHGAPQIES